MASSFFKPKVLLSLAYNFRLTDQGEKRYCNFSVITMKVYLPSEVGNVNTMKTSILEQPRQKEITF